MTRNLVYLYLISPLHTGGATQEGNLLGIARESHTDLPYIPSSTIRGRLRASAEDPVRTTLFGTELTGSETLVQGDIWIGDASILWLPVPSLSHGVVWVSSPMLLNRWKRLNEVDSEIPPEYSTNLKNGKPIYLKDAILKDANLTKWESWSNFIPQSGNTSDIKRVLVLPDQHCATLIQMSLWRQVKIKLDENKTVDGGFRYEEAIPPDTLMYFPWGTTSQANGSAPTSNQSFKTYCKKTRFYKLGGKRA